MAWQTDYGIMKEGMSILRGRKSVSGISSSERENGKKGTTLSSRELHDKEFTLYPDFMTKSSSTSRNFLLEETNTFDNSLPESKTFCFDLEEISSGSTTTHSDFSLYDSFIFDLSINPFPPADWSDFYHEEFADELAHIISPPEYDCFCLKNEPNSGGFHYECGGGYFSNKRTKSSCA
nr:hypothetical protein [Tanacetum cinerariifolium]